MKKVGEHWTNEKFVYCMADNYGHHSCQPRLFKVTVEDFSALKGKFEWREEVPVEGEEILTLLNSSAEFRAEWNTHCETCHRFAKAWQQQYFG